MSNSYGPNHPRPRLSRHDRQFLERGSGSLDVIKEKYSSPAQNPGFLRHECPTDVPEATLTRERNLRDGILRPTQRVACDAYLKR